MTWLGSAFSTVATAFLLVSGFVPAADASTCESLFSIGAKTAAELPRQPSAQIKERLDIFFSAERDITATNFSKLGDVFNKDVLIHLLREVVTDPQKLADIARRSYRHSLGFSKIILLEDWKQHFFETGVPPGKHAYDIRLHIWWPNFTSRGPVLAEGRHEHRWNFASRLITGSFENHRYDPRPLSRATQTAFQKYQNALSALPPEKQRSIIDRIEKLELSMESPTSEMATRSGGQRVLARQADERSLRIELGLTKFELGLVRHVFLKYGNQLRPHSGQEAYVQDETSYLKLRDVEKYSTGQLYFHPIELPHRLFVNPDTMTSTFIIVGPPSKTQTPGQFRRSPLETNREEAVENRTFFTAETLKSELERYLRAIEAERPNDPFARELAKDPVGTYGILEGQTSARGPSLFPQGRSVLQKIQLDLRSRLQSGSVLERPEFHEWRQRLEELTREAESVSSGGIPTEKFRHFVLKYAETLDALFRSADSSLTGTYHRDFAKALVDFVLKTGDGTHSFFTSEAVNDTYFWHIRPAATYLHWLPDPPPFLHDAKTYRGGPLVSKLALRRYIDGISLDFEEVVKHDVGHSFYMKRQDQWLFKTAGFPRLQLVAEWTSNKDRILEKWEKLREQDYDLAEAARFLLSEIIHDRGYQFYLPILRQQFATSKWTSMLLFKVSNRYWGDQGPSEIQVARFEEARLWLQGIVESLLAEENRGRIEALDAKTGPVLLKRWPAIGTYQGIPDRIVIQDAREMRVSFDTLDTRRRATSLYEIALVLAPKSTVPVLTPEKIRAIEEWIWLKKNVPGVRLLSLDSKGDLHVETAPGFLRRAVPSNLSMSERLSPIELYKLERLLFLMKEKRTTSFTITQEPETFAGRVEKVDAATGTLLFMDEFHRSTRFRLSEISLQPAEKTMDRGAKIERPGKYINLRSEDRFLSERILHEAYVRYEDSTNPDAPPFVRVKKEIKNSNGRPEVVEFELGIVKTDRPEIARAVSSLLTRSLEDAKYTNGGYLPPPVVERVQRELVSPYAVANLWGRAGHRFVLSRAAADGTREIVASALVGESRDTIFFFTSRFNNLKHSTLSEDIDFDVSGDGTAGHRWFDKFKFPDVARYKPAGYHHFANFVVEKEGSRGLGLASLMLESIIQNYSRTVLTAKGERPVHSQNLLCGKGFWQIGDPPWLARMSKLGFFPRLGAETFHVDVPWAPLLPTLDGAGQPRDHVSYNRSFNLPQMYLDLLEGKESPYRAIYDDVLRARGTGQPEPDVDHLVERIQTVIDLARGGESKLQYIQLVRPF